MTPRLSEAPTDEELREYLLANVKMSPIAWNFPDSEFSTAKLAPDYVASLRAFPLVGGSLFLQRVVDALFAGLQRLNGLPRDDPFWESRNPRPTLYKLRDFAAKTVQRDPNDVVALWTQVGLYILHGSRNFGAKQWRRLHYVGQFDVTWPILAALVTEINADPTVEPLTELLDRIEMKEEARAFLRTFDACNDPWIIEWRDAVLAALDVV